MDQLNAERYTVISADCHAGADLLDYRPYLASRHHDAFDAWAATYVNPFADLQAADADRNWDSDRRLAELERTASSPRWSSPTPSRRSSPATR